MVVLVKNRVAAALEATRMISVALEDIRQNILDVRAKLRKVEELPINKEVAYRRIEAWVEVMSAKGISPTGSSFSRPSAKWSTPNGDLSGLVLRLLAPQLEAALKAEVDAFYELKPGVSDLDRRLQLEALDRELLDLELVEESLIREAEQSGIPLLRRSDADPRAVLADQSALPDH